MTKDIDFESLRNRLNAARTAQQDQMAAASQDIAIVAKMNLDALVDQGFTREEAMPMVATFMASYLQLAIVQQMGGR